MKKLFSIVAAMAMACALAACSSPSQSSDASASASVSSASPAASSSVSASASSSSSSASAADQAEQLLADLNGTYDELFTVICAPEYDQIWVDDCKAIVGAEAAEQSAQALKAACTGTLYGDEAAKAYASNPESAQFDCFFINGVKQFTFDGNKISGMDASGNKVFEHEYAFEKELSFDLFGLIMRQDDCAVTDATSVMPPWTPQSPPSPDHALLSRRLV